MKKLLIPFILLFSVQSYAQICADEDTVRSITSSLVTYNSARINGTVSHFSGSVTGLNLRYVRVGHTDTATAAGSFSSALRNLTGLVSNTQYVYYYQTVCGSGTNRNLGTYTFTTQSNSIVYTDERPTKFNYIKIDSGFILPRTDTSIYRQPNYAGAMVMKGTIPYYYNGTSWSAFAGGNDSAYVNGVAVNDTTLRLYRDNGDSSDYILRGAAAVLGAGTVTQINQGFGMELTPSPITVTGYVAVDSNAIKALDFNTWSKVGNAGTTAGTNFIGTTDSVDLVFKTKSLERARFNARGALGLGTGTDYGTSGYLMQTNGATGAPTWVDPTSYLATIYNSDGEILTNRYLDATTYDIESLYFGKNKRLNTFQVTSGRYESINNAASITGIDSIVLIGGELRLRDSSIASGHSSNGYVFTLLNNTTGEGTWKPSSGGTTPTWQQTLTAGSTLNTDNTIAGGGFDFTWNNTNSWAVNTVDNASILTTVGAISSVAQTSSGTSQIGVTNSSTNRASYFVASYDTLYILPSLGNLIIDSLNSSSNATDSMMVWDKATGKVGIRTIPTGGGGGVTTLAAIGSSPNANGATISGSTLNLEPASASFGGVVTTGTQTFAGIKTLTSDATINTLTVGLGTGSVASNTALGYHTLNSTPSGGNNTGVGYEGLLTNTSGTDNVAVGHSALRLNTLGVGNTAIGSQALKSNTWAYGNTAIGMNAMQTATLGGYNTAVGTDAMLGLGGSVLNAYNTSIGYGSMVNNISGRYNIALGAYAGAANTADSFKLYINSIQRGGSYANDTTQSIIYGVQDATASNQRLYLNAKVYQPYATSQYNANDSMKVINPTTGEEGYRAIPTGGSGANALGTYLVQTATNAPANAQVMGALGTGLVKNTTTTGVQSIAVQSDITGLLGTGSITNTMLANTAVANLTGTNSGDNSANSTYASDYRAANFVAGTNYQVPITAGDVTTSGATAAIGAGKVTLAMQANMATASLVYRKTAGSGAPEVNTLATLKTDLAITKSDVGLGSVENTALSTWAGTANITTLGTIATGTWQGSIVAPAYLGTGASITTKFLRGDGTWQTLAGGGDMLSTNNLSDVANVTTSRNNILPSKTGNSLKVLRVNVGETDYELATISGGSLTVGSSAISSGTGTRLLYETSGNVLGEISGATSNGTTLTLSNPSINNVTGTYTTTATASGTTTLTVASTQEQYFTGANIQTVVMPDATTLTAGQAYRIVNNSSGVVTVNKNGGTLIKAMAASTELLLQVTDISTAAGVYQASYSSDLSLGNATATSLTATTVVATAGAGFQNMVVQTSGTAASWSLPAALQVTGAKFKVTIIGGGGQGGGTSTTAGQTGGGGGSGGLVVYYVTYVAGQNTMTYTVGAGGSTSTGSTTGQTGTASSIIYNSVTITASGGVGGLSGATNGAGGAGGAASGGTLNIAGFNGSSSGTMAATSNFQGDGGNTPLGFGQGGRMPSTAAGANGNPGLGYGAGGSGGRNGTGTTARNGGAGVIGVVIIEY